MHLTSTLRSLVKNPEVPEEVLVDAVKEAFGDGVKRDPIELYMITGTCGSFSDKQSWEVGVFLTQEEAFAYCGQLNKWTIRHSDRLRNRLRHFARTKQKITHPLDPHMPYGNNDLPHYEVTAIDLLGHPPKLSTIDDTNDDTD